MTAQTNPSEHASKPRLQNSFRTGPWSWLIRVAVNGFVAVAVIVLGFFILGTAQRFGFLTNIDSSSEIVGGGADASDAGQAKRYICPMMCTPPSTEPGRCPVCAMELVEAAGDLGGDGISVNIEPAARRLVGIQTAEAKAEQVEQTIKTIGHIDFDSSRMATISAYVDGRIEELFANYEGMRVSAGDDLALLYSPQLFTAQTEFLSSTDTSSKLGRFSLPMEDLSQMAKEKLVELGMASEQIAKLEKSRKPESRIRIRSPQSGTVLEKNIVEGEYLKTGKVMFRIADLSTVWMMLDLFPDDASAVRFGQQVEAEIDSQPGQIFVGRVAFINPTVDPQTRTVRVRVEFLNFDGDLRPGDYANATITVPAIRRKTVYDPALAGKFISPMHPQIIRDQAGDCPLCGMDLIATSELGFAPQPLPPNLSVTVPRSAVLMAGKNSVVYVETDPGRFEIRRVSLGPLTENEAVIYAGIDAGETVATNGNFLIDSQMQLAGNPSLLDPSKAPVPTTGDSMEDASLLTPVLTQISGDLP